jgi:transcriptional regulator with XRE-family HTH domain
MNRIAELRKKSGMNQKEFGDLFNAAQTTVSNWELGIREAPQSVLIEMADYFKVSLDYILGHDDNEKPAIVADDGLSQLREAVVKLLRDLSPEEFEKIQAYIQGLRDARK